MSDKIESRRAFIKKNLSIVSTFFVLGDLEVFGHLVGILDTRQNIKALELFSLSFYC